jgi:hypothetical protein
VLCTKIYIYFVPLNPTEHAFATPKMPKSKKKNVKKGPEIGKYTLNMRDYAGLYAKIYRETHGT